MASLRARHLLILLLAMFVQCDRVLSRKIDADSAFFKALREVSNQTNADTLNLPANASSIRENITDTFSCENRTYGYYADVDNDCQVFHVCLPSQTPSGRNVTYRWSFICPNETIFNQEVLTCTRVPDSIDCKDSPDFYHLNMEIGKVSNKTDAEKDKKEIRKIQKRKPEKRRENLVIQEAVRDIVNEESLEHLQPIELLEKGEDGPTLIEAVIESVDSDVGDVEQEEKIEEEMDRIVMERNMRNERQMRRGMLRFKGDI